MKREILFRGLSFKGEWIYGSLIQYENSAQIGVLRHPDVMDFVKVRPETVGQFTGLTDKNGKRIFEWDVVKHGNLYPNFTVKWDYESAMFKHCHKIHTDRIEIIGNIHDNPKLP